jgi:hypothetical protein
MNVKTVWICVIVLFGISIPLMAIPDFLFPDADDDTYALLSGLGFLTMICGVVAMSLVARQIRCKAITELIKHLPSDTAVVAEGTITKNMSVLETDKTTILTRDHDNSFALLVTGENDKYLVQAVVDQTLPSQLYRDYRKYLRIQTNKGSFFFAPYEGGTVFRQNKYAQETLKALMANKAVVALHQ